MKTHILGAGQFIEFILTRDRKIWVFIAQLGEHCSTNAEAMSSNPVEALIFFFFFFFLGGGGGGLNLQLLKFRLQLRWSNLHFICISAVHIIFILVITS